MSQDESKHISILILQQYACVVVVVLCNKGFGFCTQKLTVFLLLLETVGFGSARLIFHCHLINIQYELPAKPFRCGANLPQMRSILIQAFKNILQVFRVGQNICRDGKKDNNFRLSNGLALT